MTPLYALSVVLLSKDKDGGKIRNNLEF